MEREKVGVRASALYSLGYLALCAEGRAYWTGGAYYSWRAYWTRGCIHGTYKLLLELIGGIYTARSAIYRPPGSFNQFVYL